MEADLHIHSKYSQDSLLSPRLILKMAKKMGLSVIAVTDHGTLRGAKETIKEARKSHEIVVIPGIEVKTNIGDVIGLFIEESIWANDCFDVVEEMKRQNGLAVLSHPFRGHKDIPRQLMLDVDLIETLNGRNSSGKNSKAEELAFQLNKPVVAGSDAHFSFEVGCVKTIFFDQVTTLEDLRKMIVKGERRLVGRESPRLVHVFSFGVEVTKRILGQSGA